MEALLPLLRSYYQTAYSPPKLGIRDRTPDSVVFSVEHAAPEEAFQHFELEIFNSNDNTLRMTYSSAAAHKPHLRSIKVSGLPAGAKLWARVRGFVRSDKTWTGWSDSPMQFAVMARAAELDLFANASLLKQAVEELIEKLRNLELPEQLVRAGLERYNVLLLGFIGNGKTSFVNTIASALNGRYTSLDVVDNRLTSVTKELSPYEAIGGCPINLLDIWGDQDFESTLAWILGGHLGPGLRSCSSQEDHLKTLNPAPGLADKVHAVCLVFSTLSISDEKQIQAIKKLFMSLIDNKIQPVVLLTKLDQHEEANLSNGNTHTVWTNRVVDSAIAAFCHQTAIPRDFVFPVVNYMGPRVRDYALEKLALNALDIAVQIAEQRALKLAASVLPQPSSSSSPPLAHSSTSQTSATSRADVAGGSTVAKLIVHVRHSECEADDCRTLIIPEPVTYAKLVAAVSEELGIEPQTIASLRKQLGPQAMARIASDQTAGLLANNDVVVCFTNTPYH